MTSVTPLRWRTTTRSPLCCSLLSAGVMPSTRTAGKPASPRSAALRGGGGLEARVWGVQALPQTRIEFGLHEANDDDDDGEKLAMARHLRPLRVGHIVEGEGRGMAGRRIAAGGVTADVTADGSGIFVSTVRPSFRVSGGVYRITVRATASGVTSPQTTVSVRLRWGLETKRTFAGRTRGG